MRKLRVLLMWGALACWLLGGACLTSPVQADNSNEHYRAGQEAFTNKDYHLALEYFEAFVRANRDSELAPSAISQMVRSCLALELNSAALEYAGVLQSDYPGSPEAKRLMHLPEYLTSPLLELDTTGYSRSGYKPMLGLRMRGVNKVRLEVRTVDVMAAFKQCARLESLGEVFNSQAHALSSSNAKAGAARPSPAPSSSAKVAASSQTNLSSAQRSRLIDATKLVSTSERTSYNVSVLAEEYFELPVSKAGVYLVSATGGGLYCSRLLVISDLQAVTNRDNSGQGFVWFTDANTGEPVRPRQIVTAVTHMGPADLRSMTANSAGLLLLPNYPGQSYSLLACWEGNWAIVNCTAGQVANSPETAVVMLDRLAYQPGATVRWKAIVRGRDEHGYTSVKGQSYLVELVDPKQKVSETTKVSAGNNGNLRGDFTLSSAAVAGNWTVRLKNSRGHSLAQQHLRLRLQDASPLAVSVQGLEQRYLVGDKASFVVNVRDKHNHVVPGAKVKWQVYSYDYQPTFNQVPSLSWFDLRQNIAAPPESQEAIPDYERFFVSSDNASPSAAEPECRFEAVTDSAGQVAGDLEISPRLAGIGVRRLLVKVSVKSQNGELWNDEFDFIVSASAYCLELEPVGIQYAGHQGKLKVQLQDLDGKPVQAEVKVSVAGSEANSLVGTVSTDKAGQAWLDWTPSESGQMRLHAVAQSPRGRAARASTLVPVKPSQDAALLVTLDKMLYKPGSRALVNVSLPPGVKSALIVIDNGRLHNRFVLHTATSQNTIELAVGEGLFPAFTVRGYCVKQGQILNSNAQALVPRQDKVINLKIEPGTACAPGQQGKVLVTATNASGQKLQTDIVLRLFGPLGEVNHSDSNVLKTYYSRRPSEQITWCSGAWQIMEPTRLSNILASHTAKFALPNSSGDTAIWIGELRTTSSGTVEFPLTWPNMAGLWQLSAVAVSGVDMFGQTQQQVRLLKNLNAEVVGPTDLHINDCCRFVADIRNSGKTAVQCHVTANSTDQKVLALAGGGEAAQVSISLSIPAGGHRKWFIDTVAGQPGKAELTLALAAPGFKEKYTSAVSVRACGNRAEISKTCEVGQMNTLVMEPLWRNSQWLSTKTAQTVFGSGINTPTIGEDLAGAITANTELRLELVTGVSGLVSSACRTLQNSTLSAESTAAACGSLPRAIRVFRQLNLPKPSFESDFESSLEKSVANLCEAANPDGGFGWWGDMASDPEVTSFVLNQLAPLDAEDLTGVGEMRTRLCAYLSQRLPCLSPAQQAYALAGLSRYASVHRKYLDSLLVRAKRRTLEPSSGYQLALALNYSQRELEAGRLITQLRSTAIIDPVSTEVHWPASEHWSSVETTCWAIIAGLHIAPNSALIQPSVKWLARQRTVGGWASVRENALAVEALCLYLSKNPETSASFGYGIWINGNEIESRRLANKDWNNSQLVVLNGVQLPQGPLRIALMRDGNVPCWLSATEQCGVFSEHIMRQQPGYSPSRTSSVRGLAQDSATPKFSIKRVYTVLDKGGKWREVSSRKGIKVGDKIRVTLTINSPEVLENVVVKDEAFPGFTATKPAFPGVAVELDANGARFFLARVPTGNTVVSWTGTAEIAGSFVADSATANLARSPEQRAYSPEFNLKVAPSGDGL